MLAILWFLLRVWLLQSQTPSFGEMDFRLEADGKLYTNRVFDFETDPADYLLQVRVKDLENASMSQSFTIELENEVEDLDGDGVEDHWILMRMGMGSQTSMKLPLGLTRGIALQDLIFHLMILMYRKP